MIYFCTIFDSNYLSRGLAMYNSLMAHCPDFHLYIVCLDQKLYNTLNESDFLNITAINLMDIESKYPEILIAKNNRSYVEYIFTLSPVIALYTLECFSNVDMITTLDADLFFFSDPSVLFLDKSKFSIAITPHRFKKGLKSWEKYGVYNVSFQSFKNDVFGRACLNKWKRNCIEWCYNQNEAERFADQKYLDKWNEDYLDIKEYVNGSGVSPWNVMNNDISINKLGNVLYKEDPLIYYHFHGVRNISDNFLALGLNEYQVLNRKKIIKNIYEPYVKQLKEIDIDRGLKSNNIKRGMPLGFSKLIYIVFMADLYYYSDGRLVRVYNLSIFRYFYSVMKNLFSRIK